MYISVISQNEKLQLEIPSAGVFNKTETICEVSFGL